MEWWTDIWLNEGFARFAEFMALDHIHPEYRIWDQFLTDVFVYGISQDYGPSSHPIEVEWSYPDEIPEIFDGISYAKGCSVIRMINSYLGEDQFRKVIKSYLKNNEYK